MITLAVAFSLVPAGPAAAMQGLNPADTAFPQAITVIAPDSLPDITSPSAYQDLENSLDSLHSWQIRPDGLRSGADSITDSRLRQITALKSDGDSLLTQLEARQQQVNGRLRLLENKAVHLQDSIHRMLKEKVVQLRSGGRLSPEADSL